MECKFCGKETMSMLADITRKADGRFVENFPVEHCNDCNASFIDTEEITFE